MSGHQGRRAMSASRRVDLDGPQDSSPSIAQLAESGQTGIEHNDTEQYKTCVISGTDSTRNSRRSWALRGAVLATSIVIMIIPGVPQIRNYVVDSAFVFPVTTRNVTFAVGDHVSWAIDAYAPFLNSSNPLLKLGSFRLVDLYFFIPGEVPWLGGPRASPENWNLALTETVVCWEICHSRIVMDQEFGSEAQESCKKLHPRLSSARRDQARLAGYLASRAEPAARGAFLKMEAWLHRRQAMAEPGSAAAERDARLEKKLIATMLSKFVGGPWQYFNDDALRELVLLRQDLEAIAKDLGELYSHYDHAVRLSSHDVVKPGQPEDEDGQSEDGQTRAVRLHKPKPVTVAHAELLISETDVLIAALNEANERLLQLRRLLDAYRRAGWKTVELQDGVRVRTLVGLPAPDDIYKPIHERMEVVHEEAQNLWEAHWNMKHADWALVNCLIEKVSVEYMFTTISIDCLNMNRLECCAAVQRGEPGIKMEDCSKIVRPGNTEQKTERARKPDTLGDGNGRAYT